MGGLNPIALLRASASTSRAHLRILAVLFDHVCRDFVQVCQGLDLDAPAAPVLLHPAHVRQSPRGHGEIRPLVPHLVEDGVHGARIDGVSDRLKLAHAVVLVHVVTLRCELLLQALDGLVSIQHRVTDEHGAKQARRRSDGVCVQAGAGCQNLGNLEYCGGGGGGVRGPGGGDDGAGGGEGEPGSSTLTLPVAHDTCSGRDVAGVGRS
mmetsp:Transcript_26275/g.42128  ORF Transcript_26275/g.42128 Transcript_26275/m.42128 type:complete len:208 (-) Transcript_26275:204-827(-)